MSKKNIKKIDRNPNYAGATIVLLGACLLIGIGYAIGTTNQESNILQENIDLFIKNCSGKGQYYVLSTNTGDPVVCYNENNEIVGSFRIEQIPVNQKLWRRT